MSRSLVTLASIDELPPIQYMDQETINWIENNKPKFRNKKILSLVGSKKIIERYIPKKQWFFKKEHWDSIHGIRHLLRVAVWTLLYAREIKYSGNLKVVLIASVLHDVRRQNDKGDALHGLRSAKWFKKNEKEISKYFSVKLNKFDIEEIYWLMIAHELSWPAVKSNPFYKKYKNSTEIIRTADALDRYRLPKLKWWINEKKLNLKVSNSLKNTAYNLVVLSEYQYLKTRKSIESITKQLK